MTKSYFYNRKKLSRVAGWLAAALLLVSCAGRAPASAEEIAARKVRAVATTGMVADLVRAVGGERVEVRGLMGPGVDPHLYKARESDALAIERADVVFYSGLHLEAQMMRILEQLEPLGIRAVAVTSSIPAEQLIQLPNAPDAHDPHIWFDVGLWAQSIPAVRDALIALDPGSAALYQANAERYQAELEALDQEVRQTLAQVPPAQRVLITAHDAFGYFGRAYGFEVIGLQGISTSAEAGTADVQGLSQLIAERRIPAVFIESSVPHRSVEAVQAAVRARGYAVRLGGELYSDALGSPDTPAGAYTGMVRANVQTITQALSMEQQP